MSAKSSILDLAGYPRPLKVVGEEITVLASGTVTGGYEVFIQDGPEGTRPEPHYHPWDESFYVLRGEIDFNVDSKFPRKALPWTLVHVPAGTTHWFRWRSGGGTMLSITSRLAASQMFFDIDEATVGGTPSRDVMNQICGKYGCT